LTIAVAALLTLTVIEIAVRVSDARREEINREVEAARAEEKLPELKSLIDLVQPNQRGINARVLYESNSFGIRGPERAIEKLPEVFRTVVIGDSFTMGSGVLYEDTYAARLERAVPTVSGKRHEVINLGISGLSLANSLVRYKLLGARFSPDLLVYGFTINDLQGPAYLDLMECTTAREGHRESWLHLWRRIGETWLWIDDALREPEFSYVHEINYNYFHNEAAWKAFDDGLSRLAEEARTRGICGVVLIHTQLHALNRFHPYLDVYARVARAAADKGLYVIDPFPLFRGRSAGSLWVTPADSHPGPEGHEILARALIDGLRHLPPSCGVTFESVEP
jgi:lysophospholipase L1-like esterase